MGGLSPIIANLNGQGVQNIFCIGAKIQTKWIYTECLCMQVACKQKAKE